VTEAERGIVDTISWRLIVVASDAILWPPGPPRCSRPPGWSAVIMSDKGRSVGLGRCQTATVDCGNSPFDLAATASAAVATLPGTAAAS